MIAQADALRIPLPSKSVHCVTTSPPYWGLRKYAGDQGRIWGGDPECEHEWGPLGPAHHPGQVPQTKTGNADASVEGQNAATGQYCSRCGAWYGSLGLEPSPEQHVENIVEIFREVRRVLRDDGVLWLNYGDCYASGGGTHGGGKHAFSREANTNRSGNSGSLMMMPHRVALALQADGWIVRQDLVWSKSNPMPESVNGWRFQGETCECKRGRAEEEIAKHVERTGADRRMAFQDLKHSGLYDPDPDCSKCGGSGRADDLELKRGSWRHTRAHEYVFMLTKKMQYWSNQEAVRETIQSGPSDIRKMEQGLDRIGGKNKNLDDPLARASAATKLGQKRAVGNPSGRNPRSVLDVPTDSMEVFYHWLGERVGLDLYELIEQFQDEATNPGDVLDVPTAPYSGAHYATFPPNLIAPLIRATCPRWACPVCGQGWAAVVEKGEVTSRGGSANPERKRLQANEHHRDHGQSEKEWTTHASSVLGYKPTCEHPHTQEEAVPGIVFDPFLGSGTSVAVAKQLLRRGIGIDISMEYLDQQAKVRAGLGTPSKALEDLPLFQ